MTAYCLILLLIYFAAKKMARLTYAVPNCHAKVVRRRYTNVIDTLAY